MLDELIKDINELIEYKRLYEHQKKDKKRMSEELYKLMMYKYNNTSYEERVYEYEKNNCKSCRYQWDCRIKLPENIMEPIPSDDWIPATKSCGEFQWS